MCCVYYNSDLYGFPSLYNMILYNRGTFILMKSIIAVIPSRFLYPGIVSLLVSSVSFPLGLGQFMAGDLNTHDQVYGLFTNFTWTKENLGVEEMNIVRHWSTPYTDVFSGLLCFVLVTVRQSLFTRLIDSAVIISE